MQVVVGARTYELSETLQSDELAPIFADAWTASRVWDASAFLSTHLVEFAATQRHPFDMRGQRSASAASDAVSGSLGSSSASCTAATVIELGSGCGLAGLVAAALGGDVLLTDQREAVELLQRNVAANAASDDERARLAVCEFTWGSDPSTALPCSTYDYILISDCINPIYGTESWRNLARSIRALSGAHTVTYLAHEQRGDDEAMADFLAFSADSLVIEQIAARARLRLYKIRRS